MPAPRPAQVEAPAPTPAYVPLTADQGAQASTIDFMRDHFSKQRKVSIKIPLDRGEQWVQVNGYTFQIMAGERVNVPEQVAQILEDAGVV